MLSMPGRAAMSKVTEPVAKALLSAGLTPNGMTIIGTFASVVASIALFPTNHLFWAAIAVWWFVMLDMIDGAMARARGGGTKYGAVLDATCDRIADGAIFGGLAWWAAFHEDNKWLVAGALTCLVTSQVTSYAKARAEASGLSADGGLIERPERLIIVLAGAGFTGIGQHFEWAWLTWSVYVALPVLAVLSVVTVIQRVYAVHSAAGARELIAIGEPK